MEDSFVPEQVRAHDGACHHEISPILPNRTHPHLTDIDIPRHYHPLGETDRVVRPGASHVAPRLIVRVTVLAAIHEYLSSALHEHEGEIVGMLMPALIRHSAHEQQARTLSRHVFGSDRMIPYPDRVRSRTAQHESGIAVRQVSGTGGVSLGPKPALSPTAIHDLSG